MFFSIGTSFHLSHKPTPSLDASPWSEPEAVDVELTAYVLLTWLSKANLTQNEINKATGIVAWLVKQQNAYGGFSSTQVSSLLFCHSSGRVRSHVEREEKPGLDLVWRERKNYCPCPLGPGTNHSIEREKIMRKIYRRVHKIRSFEHINSTLCI